MIKSICTGLFMLIASIGAMGQSDVLKFSLDEAQQYAMEHSYISQNTGIEVETARKKVWETIATGLPQVDAAANYNAFLDLAVSLIPGEFLGQEPGTYVPVKFGQDFSADFGLSVSQLLFDGSYIIGLKAARVYLELAQNTQEKTQIDIREAVASAYFNVLVAMESRKVNEDNLTNTRKLLTETQAYYDNGFREEQDVDQIRLMMKQAENELIKDDREIRVSKMVLKYAMGVDVDDTIVLTDSLAFFLDPIREKGTLGKEFDYNQHIDHRILETQLSLRKSQLDLEKAAYLPKLEAFYSYTRTSYSDNANLFREEWFPSSMIGVQVTMPIFNSGMKSSRVQQARLQLELKQNEQLMSEQNLQMRYITALTDLESALDKFENDLENSEIASRIYNKTRIKFNNGLATSNDLSQNESQYLTAYGNYLLSMLQVLQTKLQLDKAVGEL